MNFGNFDNDKIRVLMTKDISDKDFEDIQEYIERVKENILIRHSNANKCKDRIKSNLDICVALQTKKLHVAEVTGTFNSKKVLVKDMRGTEYASIVASNINIKKLTNETRVALSCDTRVIERILPEVVDPRVSSMLVEEVPDTTYDMIGGLDKEIKLIKECIELPLTNPEIFASIGISQPKGVLLYGVPGTGKTLLAQAVAHHTKCKFIRVSGSEFSQKYIGDGAEMIREVFKMARKHAPSIVFIDEIDSIGSSRNNSNGDNEVQRTMLELLNQLDGFHSDDNVKVIMATNRIDVLDKALIRPGRIDRKIQFSNPNSEARLNILKIHSSKMNLADDVQFDKISKMLDGGSGAELKAVCNEAGIFALRERRKCITNKDFENAASKVISSRKDKNDETKFDYSLSRMWL